MAISELRKQLRKAGIRDENMHFADAADRAIIPRLVLQSHEVAIVEDSGQLISIRSVETHGPSRNQDNPE
jgi:hypothetical protein